MKEKWKADFEKNGFIGPFKAYEPEEAKAKLNEIRKANFNRQHILWDNDLNYERHFDVPELTQHICHPAIVEKLIAILGPDIICWRNETFPKFPGSPGTQWHQVEDFRYTSGTPALVPIENHPNLPMDLTVWTAFTDATIENGCMKFLPGSHKKRYYDESKTPVTGRDKDYNALTDDTPFYGYDFEDFKVDPDWSINEDEAVSMEMKAGEFVIFTSRCCHASHPNITKRSTRIAITTRYVPTFVKVYPGQDSFFEHGATCDLKDYGVVLIAGEDKYGHNRIRTTNNLGQPFPYYQDNIKSDS